METDGWEVLAVFRRPARSLVVRVGRFFENKFEKMSRVG